MFGLAHAACAERAACSACGCRSAERPRAHAAREPRPTCSACAQELQQEAAASSPAAARDAAAAPAASPQARAFADARRIILLDAVRTDLGAVATSGSTAAGGGPAAACAGDSAAAGDGVHGEPRRADPSTAAAALQTGSAPSGGPAPVRVSTAAGSGGACDSEGRVDWGATAAALQMTSAIGSNQAAGPALASSRGSEKSGAGANPDATAAALQGGTGAVGGSQAAERLAALLCAYAVHDPATGYCQGCALSCRLFQYVMLVLWSGRQVVNIWQVLSGMMRRLRTPACSRPFLKHQPGVYYVNYV